jgi:ATP-dependent RNA helicase DeaD
MLSEGVEQLFYVTSESNKPEILCKLIDAADDFYGIIFCQTKSLVADLTRYLLDRDYKVDCLHGDMEQNARERTMQAFRDHKVQMLICTDVASRGLDVKDITHVINYSIPRELDSYVHRIGRTARSGKKGYAMSLVTPSHRGLVGRIEKMTKSQMKEGKVPTRKEIGIKKVAQVLAKFESEKNFKRSIDLLSPEWKTALAAMNGEEIAGRLLSMMYPEVFSDNRAEKAEAQAQSQTGPAPRGQVLVAGSVPPPVRLSGSFTGGRDRGDRPSYGDRPAYGDRPKFNRDRPSFKERGGFSSGFGAPRGEFARDRKPHTPWNPAHSAGKGPSPRPSSAPVVSEAGGVKASVKLGVPGAFGKRKGFAKPSPVGAKKAF